MKTRHEMLMEDPEYRKLYAIEGLVADAAELVASLMKEQNLTKADLARRLGKSRAWVTQVLSGRANMTMRTFAELVYALGAQVTLSARPPVRMPGRATAVGLERLRNGLRGHDLTASWSSQPAAQQRTGSTETR